ncbi:MAG: pyridoxamine 5'-phosphate oxidase family protein [Solirubrobacterales bacterium]
MGEPEPTEVARAIIDEIAYMTIATADADGTPWASPVWFAHAGYSEFVWISRPDARHSRNIAARAGVGIVIFDSRTPIDTGRGVYLEATAEQVTDDAEVDRLMAAFSNRSVAQGGSAYSAADVSPPAHLRPYRATVNRAFLGINDLRTEVDLGD